MMKENHIPPQEKETENDDSLYCSVKNCGRKIKPGTEIKINGKIYCPLCGTNIITKGLGI